MTTTTPHDSPLRFGDWEVRAVARELIVRGTRAHIGSRAFDVLLALVQRRGETTTKNELLDAAWPGLVVEENNISVQIAALRKLLGAHAIATVAGLGYRLAVAADVDTGSPPAADHERPSGVAAPAAASQPVASIELIGRDA